jgi:hypothetical protein
LKHEIYDGALLENLSLGDTITIESTTYFKANLNGNLLGYFREDSTAGKAWFWAIDDTSEYLIMDLSLNIGDIFLVKMYSDSLVTVSSIDVVNNRKELTLNYNYGGGFIAENLKFIEGVGPNAAMFYQVEDKDQAFNNQYLFGYLVCKMYHDTIRVYAWDTVNFECGSFVGIQEMSQPENLTIEVFPNPTNGLLQFTIKDTSLFNRWLFIYNILGQKLFRCI